MNLKTEHMQTRFGDLQELFQLATKLELFTLPLYLYAYYSIKKPKQHIDVDEASYSIRKHARLHLGEVIREEMLHLAIVSNVMHSIEGCAPPLYSPIYTLREFRRRYKIDDLMAHGKKDEIKKIEKELQVQVDWFIPFYPDSMPLYKEQHENDPMRKFVSEDKAPVFHLDHLNISQIVTFMDLELPDIEDPDKDDFSEWETIGEFYNFIKEQMNLCRDMLIFNPKEQISLTTHNPTKGYTKYVIISDLKTAIDQLELIIEQGEGTSGDKLADYPDEVIDYVMSQIRTEKKSLKEGMPDSIKKFVIEKHQLDPETQKVDIPGIPHFYHFKHLYKEMGGNYEAIDIKNFKKEKAKYIKTGSSLTERSEIKSNDIIQLTRDPAVNKELYPPEAKKANLKFNSVYSELLDSLTVASKEYHMLRLGDSIKYMNMLDSLAEEIIKYPLEGSSDVFCGPSFEYVFPWRRIH